MTYANYDDVAEQIRSHGLLIKGNLSVNTPKPVRVFIENGDREKRGWFWLNEVMIDGAAYLVGAYGIYQGNDSGKQTVRLNRRDEKGQLKPLVPDPALRAAMKARHEENSQSMKAFRSAEAERAAHDASRVWKAYVPSGESDYLNRKGVAAHGVRFDPNGHGTVVVPMCDAYGKVHGLQIIRGKNRGNKLEKQYFPAGLSKQGHYHLIGGSPVWICLVAEGYATAASLYQATNLPVAVAFDAGNLIHVATTLRKAYTRAKFLVCADDDYLTDGNPGITLASAAALAVSGAWVAPGFASDRGGNKITDFNDLHALQGLHAVRSQIETRLRDLKWQAPEVNEQNTHLAGSEGKSLNLKPLLSVDEACARYALIYNGGGVFFDNEHRGLVPKADVLDICPDHAWREWKLRPDRRVVRMENVGFDPGESDPLVTCNMWGGWPTEPREGKCTALLALLQYLCSGEHNCSEVYPWVLCWLAYPIQHPGAKMQSAIVMHGGQGTGKSLFFESYMRIFGPYAKVLDQTAIEDRFNADWAQKKLFVLADEVLARQDMFHIKNRLKGFITGNRIRVNPKNVTAHEEANHMNIAFLSNEKMPIVLEIDDRRYCVIWVPSVCDKEYYLAVEEERQNGGVEALHHYLLNLDLGDFKPWTRPPMTQSKQDLIQLGLGSEERFYNEWRSGELELKNGEAVPFCPCLGMDLYRVYEFWCRRNGESRPRATNQFLNFFTKQPGWIVGKSQATWDTLHGRSPKSRKMAIPSDKALAAHGRSDLARENHSTKQDWLTACYFAFTKMVEVTS
ncbi:DUF5906 domain-containing protein [Candidatus Nitrotoga sp. M5]|uniref:DUF5906 domain-containing protein n=1 Tax=Candidatus Nitrotoga sp. M5 TaxID=2890409 RepID=UPI001EF61865|nr:DUF5906 domain-containing protein [Candidatus Nitrotoga sp. M5]CAH1387979.1 hypothetical protein NTGM5_760009 [Candidatus Nitrotoga sp. M5]